ncbi:MAG: ATP-binding protein [Acetobacteraceae bacterium]
MLVFETVAESLEADVCINYRLDAKSGRLRLVAGPGIPEGLLQAAGVVQIAEAYCGTVAATGAPLIADAERIAVDDKGAFARQVGLRAYACFPLFDSTGKLLGTFCFGSTRRNAFTDEEVEFIRTLCHFVALAWQRLRAEAALRESEARFRVITDAMPQLVWSTRPDGHPDYCNQRWYDITGISRAQRGPFEWHSLIHPDDKAEARCRWTHSLATGEPYQAEYRLRTATGEYRWMLGRAVPVRDPATGAITRWFGTCTDIEETIAARETLRRTREDLELLVAERTRDLQVTQEKLAHAQRLDALGQLAGGIAHDFNNVLQAVHGSGALLERQPDDSSAVRRLAQRILRAAERGASITRRLLYFSQRGDLRAEPVDPTALQSGMREILAHTLGDGIDVRLEVEPDLPPLLADKGQLETVLINFGTNARDAMSGMGVLTLSAAREIVPPNRSPEHPAGLKPGDYIRLAVSDTGVGMDAATLTRATDPFFTTKPQGQGTGLGLAMARGFAEQSGGRLDIVSRPGHGTTVILWLPVADEAAITAGTEPEEDWAATSPDATGPRLLLVDDDDSVREVIAEQMDVAGFDVLPCGSAADALAAIEAGTQVDVIVSDLSMPDMSGIDLINRVQHLRPGLPAILLTGYATDAAEVAIGGAVGGAFSLVRKPVSGRQLVEHIAVLLEGSPVSLPAKT